MSIHHPVLSKLYANLADYQQVLFLDESVDISPTTDPSHTRGFYIIAGSVLTKDTLDGTRTRLREIVGHNYFHTTEALQTTRGTQTVRALLDQCHQWKDKHLLVVKTRLKPEDDIEHARQQCLTKLIQKLDTNTRAIIFEKRQHNKDNNADQALIKKLRQNKVLSDQTRTVWVSPTNERLLWLPDLVAMTYRRTITHTDDTSTFFESYLAENTTVTILKDEPKTIETQETQGVNLGLLEEGDLTFHHDQPATSAQSYESHNQQTPTPPSKKNQDASLEN